MNQFVTAAAMARAVATDPDITLPVRPKLCEGLCLLPVRGGLLIDGAAERQFLSGRGASDLLPRLLPALDGEQDVAGIAARIGAPIAHVQAAVALLYTRGVIEEGGGPPAENAADIFFSRASDSTAVNANGAEARARLERAKVIIVGEDRFAERLLNLIRRSGVGQCSLISPAGIDQALEPLSARSAAHRVVVLLDDRVAPDLDAACRPIELPWLWVSRAHRELGPVFQGEASACWTCARRGGVVAGAPEAQAEDPAIETLLLGLAAGNLVHLISRVGSIPALRCGARFTPGDPRPSVSFAARQQGCPVCSPLPTGTLVSPVRSAALIYEEFVEAAPPELLNPRTHRSHYNPANIALQQVEKQRPTLPRIELPRPQTLAQAAAHGGGGQPGPRRIALGEVALMSERIAGLKTSVDGKSARWAPTGGNLGSVQLYWAIGDALGLDAGLYHYSATGHRFAIVGGEQGYQDFIAALPSDFSAGAAGFLLLTAALPRVSRKYHLNAYRLVALDAGCAVAQLRLVAQALGFRLRVASRWDEDSIAEVICTPPGAEPVTAIVALLPAEASA